MFLVGPSICDDSRAQDLERRLAALTAEYAAMTIKFTALSVTSDRLTAENNALSFRIANLTGLVDQLNTSLEKEKQTNGRLKIDNYNLKRSIKAAEVRFILGSKVEVLSLDIHAGGEPNERYIHFTQISDYTCR